jgi:hypothetical protein
MNADHGLDAGAPMLRGIAVLLCTVMGFSASAARGQTAPSNLLNAHWGDETIEQYRVLPDETVKLMFPSGSANLSENSLPGHWQASTLPIFRVARFVRVKDTQGRFGLSGAVYGGQLFIFDDLFCGQAPSTMSRLIRATRSFPKTKADALALAELYLSIAHFDFQDPTEFVEYRPAREPAETGLGFEQSSGVLFGETHSPTTVRAGSGYKVDLFTGNVIARRHWRMNITPTGFELDTRACDDRSRTTCSSNPVDQRVTFTRGMMADGLTDDGGIVDIQGWDASDGQQVSRVHSYYKNVERAQAAMEQTLSEALTVIESRPWLDSQGKSIGRSALVIRPQFDKKGIMAERIFHGDTSILEYYGPCMRDVKAAGELE